MQQQLRVTMGEVVVHSGKPPAENLERNRSVFRHTFARKRCRVTAYGEGAVSSEDPLENKFVIFFHGNLAAPHIEHYCGPWCGCTSLQATQDAMYGVAIELDILAANCEDPSVDDWHSTGEACGCLARGFAVHDLFSRVYLAALPTWASMNPDSGDDRAREKVQNRVGAPDAFA